MSIDHLQKTKEALLGTGRNMRLANDEAQGVTSKSLARGTRPWRKILLSSRRVSSAFSLTHYKNIGVKLF
jgi:hypothetical protein